MAITRRLPPHHSLDTQSSVTLASKATLSCSTLVRISHAGQTTQVLHEGSRTIMSGSGRSLMRIIISWPTFNYGDRTVLPPNIAWSLLSVHGGKNFPRGVNLDAFACNTIDTLSPFLSPHTRYSIGMEYDSRIFFVHSSAFLASHSSSGRSQRRVGRFIEGKFLRCQD